MTVRKLMRVTTFAGALLYCVAAVAQTPAPSPKKPAPPVKTNAGKLPATPQVVTIIHRLNALKMLRLLARSEQQVQSVAALGSAFNLMDDVHANVIAGLALDDGETIAAWLPDAEVEFGPQDMAPFVPVAPRAPKPPRAPAPRLGFYDSPDITVIGPEGKRLAVRYVGLDAVTGLSILRLTNKSAVSAGATTDETLNAGETVLLFSPEPVTRARAMLRGGLYARMAAIEGRIRDVMPAPSGGVARFKVSASKLSQANLGGVAVNEAGETIGIVDGLLEGNEASILPIALIRRAAERVLEQQASVPRPWLGVKGEAIAALNLDQIQNHGWELQRAEALAGNDRGILLTSVMPDSPAAKASLRAGDVILKVDNKEIQTADDFTWWLEQASPSSLVEFTVARPDRPAEEPLNVRLSGLLHPALNFNLRTFLPRTKGSSLIEQGIETIALKPPVASQLGTTAGLLVVYVEPQTAASEAGLQAGDVIQSIDGKPVSSFKPATQPASLTFEIVRNKEKLHITVAVKKK